MSRVILHVLGTAQDGGLPSPNCFCENCRQAMMNPELRRGAASLAVILPDEKQWHIIDLTPDFKEQIIKLQLIYDLKEKMMESVCLTHGHIGHYTGLMFLGKEAMNTKRMPVFTGSEMAQFLKREAPWRQLVELGNIELHQLIDGEVEQKKRFTMTPVEVPHRNEFSETFGFWIEGPSKKVLYIPDIDRWDDWSVDIVEAVKEADICLLDGTFFSEKDLSQIGRDFREIPHPVITNTINRLQSVVSQSDIYFTHMNHNNPAIAPDSAARKYIEERGFKVAEDDMHFEL